MFRLVLPLLLACGAYAAAPKPDPRQAPPRVLVAPFAGVISPVAAEFLTHAVQEAEAKDFDALVIELDTPGGLDPSMRSIIQAVMNSKVPVLVYVFPPGARAASAGAFITMAGHVAAMAPGTNIGAAHPVAIPAGGGVPGAEKKKDDGAKDVMEDKMANDAAAYLRSIARERGRNEEWAAKAVLESASLPVVEAVAQKVVDLQAPSLEELLRQADGRKLPGFKMALRTGGAKVERFEMTRRQRLLAALSDPNVAMILMSLGAAGLFIELYSPGLVLPGVVGAVCLVLAFYSFQTLSASYAGVILLLLGFLFFLLEVKVTSFGLLALSGVASILLGVLMLFRDQPAGGLRVAWSVVGGLVGSLVGLTALASTLVVQAHRRRKELGAEAMVGATAEVLRALAPKGKVRFGGEVWDAVSLEGTAAAGDSVVIEAVEGLLLKVRPKRSFGAGPAD